MPPDQLGLALERLRHRRAVFFEAIQAADEEEPGAADDFRAVDIAAVRGKKPGWIVGNDRHYSSPQFFPETPNYLDFIETALAVRGAAELVVRGRVRNSNQASASALRAFLLVVMASR
jgi:hypothetical protein